MTSGRVLYVTTRFPFPADRGDRVHAFHMIRALSRRFSVTVAAFDTAPENSARGEDLFRGWGVRTVTAPLPRAGRTARLAGALWGGRPLQVAYYDEPALREKLAGLGRAEPPFDALVCHLIRAVPTAASVPARIRVISLCDSLSLGLERRLRHAPLLERPSIWMEARRVASYEARVLDRFDEGWVVSEIDRAAFRDDRKLKVIPNGVDASLFEGDIPARPGPVVGFLGHLGVPHNVDGAVSLVNRIMPLVWARGVEAKVRLIGPEPSASVRALARRPNVELVGFTSDLRRALGDMRVFCAPLRFSAGIQNKLIEAAAVGVPVISSPQAVRALGSQAEEHIQTAETPEQYADAILTRWSFGPERMGQLLAARHWVRGRFRWEAFAERLEWLLAADRHRGDGGEPTAMAREVP